MVVSWFRFRFDNFQKVVKSFLGSDLTTFKKLSNLRFDNFQKVVKSLLGSDLTTFKKLSNLRFDNFQKVVKSHPKSTAPPSLYAPLHHSVTSGYYRLIGAPRPIQSEKHRVPGHSGFQPRFHSASRYCADKRYYSHARP